ncbi:MAG: LacI family transcriptional regulator [Ruminococcaceae bacterium]|nr:LacI family transcriptional regulator [Oscillospiraceae bacterium]
MKEDTLAELAKKLNISKSTVSKAVRHCSGVDSDTRQLILESIPKGAGAEQPFSVYTILPDVPQYFWKEMQRGLMDGGNQQIAPVKHNIYTRCGDESTVLDYLSEAEKMDIRVLILATYVTPEIRRRLENFPEKCMILLLSEHFERRNAFYIGADAYGDGRKMGEAYLSTFGDRKLLYFNVLSNENAKKRTEGFLDVIREKCPGTLCESKSLDIENKIFRDLKMLSSRLASLLSSELDKDSRYCLYSPVGMIKLPIAIKKAALEERVVCICHDCFTEQMQVPEGFAVCCNQDVYAQGYAAAKAALEYAVSLRFPKEKNLFIPSRIDRQQE